jgi:hypothetical protein
MAIFGHFITNYITKLFAEVIFDASKENQLSYIQNGCFLNSFVI